MILRNLLFLLPILLLASCGCDNENLTCPDWIPSQLVFLKAMEKDTMVFENETGKRIHIYSSEVSQGLDDDEACHSTGLGQCLCLPCDSYVNMTFRSLDSADLFWTIRYRQVYDVETDSWVVAWQMVLDDSNQVHLGIPIRQSELIEKETPSLIGAKTYAKAFRVKSSNKGTADESGHVFVNSKVGLIGFLDVRTGTFFSRVD